MIPGQNTKKVVVLAPQSVEAAATATGTIDTLGYDSVSLDLLLGPSDQATNNPSVLKLSESDNNSDYSDVSSFVGDTAFTIPNSVTSGGQVLTFNIDARQRKRYLKLSISPTATQLLAAVANLHRAEQAPVGVTAQNAALIVNG